MVALSLTDGLFSEKSRMWKKKRKKHYNDRFSDLLKLVKRGPAWKEVVIYPTMKVIDSEIKGLYESPSPECSITLAVTYNT